MLKQGILILSHKGQSYANEIIAINKRMGLESYVLSSNPGKAAAARIPTLRTKANWIEVVSAESLREEDVKKALAVLRKEGIQVLACISVWENYRKLMAGANELLKAADLSTKAVTLVTDKLSMRRKLLSSGLSRIQTQTVTEKSLARLQNSSQRYFLKPRRGIASFGAFALQKSTQWSDLVSMQKQMLKDKDYRAYFEKDSSFIAEDYITGPEFSFEIIASAGTPHIVAVHEKTELQEANGATLENACVSPPISLSREQIEDASGWIEAVFKVLGLGQGCFHVEARKTGTGWEIVEINPRIGGAFIVKSTNLVSDGFCLIEAWIQTLLRKESAQVLRRSSTRSKNFFARKTATFFRVYFAEPNRKIARVSVKKRGATPVERKFFLESGAKTPSTSREVFLGQMLWALPNSKLQKQTPALLKSSADMVEVTYATK